jgi:hypothetical protein
MLAAPPVAEPAPVEMDVLGVQVRWSGPPGCPDRDAVKAALEQGDAEAAPDESQVSVEAEIRATDDHRWSMQAEVASPTGRERRKWIADDCKTITRLLVVIVGSALARAREESPVIAAPPPDPPPPPTKPKPKPTPTPTPKPPTATAPPTLATTPTSKRRARTEVALRIGGGIESGGLPVVGTAFDGGLVVSRPRWRIDATALWVMPRGTTLPSGDGGAVLQIGAAAVRGCARVGRTIEVPLCAGLELGGVRGRGTLADKVRSDTVLWAAALLGPGVRVPLRRRIALVLDTTLAIPLGRPRFDLRGLGQVYRARTGVRALFGLEFRLR